MMSGKPLILFLWSAAALFVCLAEAAAQDVPPALDLPINPAVTQSNMGQTICMEGWTKSVRPPYFVTNRIKLAKLRAAGLPEADKSRFELDHLIPLSLGGAVADPRNLALESWDEAEQKDEIESCLSAEVCAGQLTLNQARQAIWEDWRSAGKFCQQ